VCHEEQFGGFRLAQGHRSQHRVYYPDSRCLPASRYQKQAHRGNKIEGYSLRVSPNPKRRLSISMRPIPAISTRIELTVPFSLKRAPFNAAPSTPLGLQLNLYPRGTSAFSGAGRPPQNEVKETIRLFCARILERSDIAEQ